MEHVTDPFREARAQAGETSPKCGPLEANPETGQSLANVSDPVFVERFADEM
jgi:hypothetical protein